MMQAGYTDTAAIIVAVTVPIIHDYVPIIVAVTVANIVRDCSACTPNSPVQSGKIGRTYRGDSDGP
jgi:hypothetical protein